MIDHGNYYIPILRRKTRSLHRRCNRHCSKGSKGYGLFRSKRDSGNRLLLTWWSLIRFTRRTAQYPFIVMRCELRLSSLSAAGLMGRLPAMPLAALLSFSASNCFALNVS